MSIHEEVKHVMTNRLLLSNETVEQIEAITERAEREREFWRSEKVDDFLDQLAMARGLMDHDEDRDMMPDAYDGAAEEEVMRALISISERVPEPEPEPEPELKPESAMPPW